MLSFPSLVSPFPLLFWCCILSYGIDYRIQVSFPVCLVYCDRGYFSLLQVRHYYILMHTYTEYSHVHPVLLYTLLLLLSFLFLCLLLRRLTYLLLPVLLLHHFLLHIHVLFVDIHIYVSHLLYFPVVMCYLVFLFLFRVTEYQSMVYHLLGMPAPDLLDIPDRVSLLVPVFS